MLALFIAVGITLGASLALRGPWHALLAPWLGGLGPGPYELVGHLLYGLPAALLSLVALRALRLGPLTFRPSWRPGLLLGVVSVLVCLPFASPGPGLTVWGCCGNLVSNLYEELSFRALLGLAALRCVDRPVFAGLVSALVFTAAGGGRVQLFVLGCLWAAAFLRSRNLFVPWLAHTLTDCFYA